MYIPWSALSGLEPIGEGVVATRVMLKMLFSAKYCSPSSSYIRCKLLNYSPGQFGKVYKAILTLDTQEEVAVKPNQRYTSENEMHDFMREMNIMADIMHPNIIQLYGLVNKGQLLSSCM